MESLGGDVKSPYFISSVEPGVGRELTSWELRFGLRMFAIYGRSENRTSRRKTETWIGLY